VLASIFHCKENDGTIGAALLHQILPVSSIYVFKKYEEGKKTSTQNFSFKMCDFSVSLQGDVAICASKRKDAIMRDQNKPTLNLLAITQ